MTAELVPMNQTQNSLDLVVPAYELAEKIAKTDFVPSALRGKPESVLAAILTGHELGIGPMQSLAKIHVIEGRPAMAAELMRALVLAKGHDLWVVEANNTRCTVGAKRSGSDRESTFTWTKDDAKTAGLDGRKNWRQYPRAMLLARATSEAIRAVFPDVVAGVSYSVEELTDGDVLDPDAATETPDPPAPTSRRVKAPRAVTPEVPLPGETSGVGDVPSEETATALVEGEADPSPAPVIDIPEPHGYELWPKTDLELECKERDIPHSGNRDRLIRELRAWDAAFDGAESDVRPF